MTEIFLIDGYNLMHRGYGPLRGDLESGRRSLEKRLARFLDLRPRARILLVYDGAYGVNPTVSSGRSGPIHDRLARVYSEAPESADDRILLESSRRAGTPHTVVSSDRKDIVRHLGPGVSALRSEDFMMLVEDALDGLGRPEDPEAGRSAVRDSGGEKPSELSAEEIAEWMREFGASVPEPPEEDREA